MKRISIICGSLMAAALLFTSCLDTKENSQQTTLTYGGESCFNFVTDLETGETSISTNPNYIMRYDLTAGTVDVEMSNIRLSSSLSGMAFKFPTLKYVYDTKTYFYNTTATAVQPIGGGASYLFDSFTMKVFPNRPVNNTSISPVYLMKYTVNNAYSVTVFPSFNVFLGNTSSRPTYEGATTGTYTSTTPVLGVDIDAASKTASLIVDGIKFEEDLPSIAFMIKGLPVNITAEGFTINAAGPYQPSKSDQTAINGCTLSDIVVSSSIMSGATTISFQCDMSAMSTTVNKYGSYSVTSNLSYFPERKETDKN